MNWWQFLGSVLVTGLLALLTMPVAARLFPRHPGARTAALLVAVVLGLPYHAGVGDWLEDTLQPAPTPADRSARRWGRETARLPELQRALAGRGQAEADALAAGFARAGLCTLTESELDHRARIAKMLSETGDDEVAAGLFTGTLGGAKLKAALNQLPAPEIDAWFELAYDATAGALHGTPPSVPDARQQARAIRELVAATQLDGTRLLGVMADPQPKVADAAWAARKIYATLFTLPTDKRVAIERALVAPRTTAS